MKKLSFLAVCLFSLFASKAQSDSAPLPVKQKSFNVSIHTLDQKLIHGRLLAINDSQLVLLKANGHYVIPSENIRSFTLKRKNRVLKGTLIGLGVGAITGVIAGLASGDDPLMEPSASDWGISAAINNAFAMTAREKAVVMGTSMGLSGAIIGAIVGAVAKKKFMIGGRKEKFRDLQAELMMKLVKK